MLQSLNHLTLAVSDLQKASPSGTSCWGLRCTPAGIPGPISPAAICGSACRTTRRAGTCRRRRATIPTTRLPWRKRILNRSRKGWSRRASPSGSRTKARGVVLFSRPGRAQAGAARGQPRRAAGGVSREALRGHGVYLRRGLRRAPSACPQASRAWRHLPDCTGTPPPAVPARCKAAGYWSAAG